MDKEKLPRFRMPMKYIGKKDLKIEQSINNARERWERCLKEANGNIKKARELYNKR